MKRVMVKTFFIFLIAFSMAMASNAMSSDVYKVVDKDGNVTYTDKPPADGSAPIKLAPISVIETPVYELPVEADSGDDVEKEMSLRDMRRQYADFAIVAPQQEESIWHPDSPVIVAWSVRNQLEVGMQVTISVDSAPHAKTTAQSVPVPQLDRGEHKIEAQLTDSRNRTIATAEPITFFVRRPGLNNRARAR